MDGGEAAREKKRLGHIDKINVFQYRNMTRIKGSISQCT